MSCYDCLFYCILAFLFAIFPVGVEGDDPDILIFSPFVHDIWIECL